MVPRALRLRVSRVRPDYPRVGLAVLSAALLFTGGIIYVGFRERTLVMFRWFSQAGITEPVSTIRHVLHPLKASTPAWLYLSLPTTLWLLSGMFMLACMWRGGPTLRGKAWVVLFLSTALGGELLQMPGLVPGTFDPVDLAMMLAGVPIVLLWERICRLPEVNE